MLTSPAEWGILAAVGILLFGSKRIPEVGRALGEGLCNFKRSLHFSHEEFARGLESEEEETEDSTSSSSSP